MKKVYIMSGIPGSGKSTWIQEQLKAGDGIWHSRDLVRFSMLEPNDDYFAKEPKVFETWINNILQSINNVKGPDKIYVDATHINKYSREKVLNRLPVEDIELVAVNFLTPLNICLERNEMREGRSKVPLSEMRSMFRDWTPINTKENHGAFKSIINVS